MPWLGMQSLGVWSLNHDTTTSLGLSYAPIYPKIHPHPYGRNSVRVHPYPHPQHLKLLKHFYTSNMVGGCSLLGFAASTMTPQYHSDLAMPQFSKIYSHPYGRNSVRVHPYAHPQHLKVLKHFVYIQYGCGMQSMGVCSLNHDTKHHTGSAIPRFP